MFRSWHQRWLTARWIGHRHFGSLSVLTMCGSYKQHRQKRLGVALARERHERLQLNGGVFAFAIKLPDRDPPIISV